ncbi:hypothetical protein [Acuticoccus yangtzensis]|uniref:hypothetical protein n=1 Tax=Acuticoccus yangtzensis TaxID=1443441 RepID=UPI0013003822|nr:hypothetical protein [Acuticoccus yangtzensis]
MADGKRTWRWTSANIHHPEGMPGWMKEAPVIENEFNPAADPPEKPDVSATRTNENNSTDPDSPPHAPKAGLHDGPRPPGFARTAHGRDQAMAAAQGTHPFSKETHMLENMGSGSSLADEFDQSESVYVGLYAEPPSINENNFNNNEDIISEKYDFEKSYQNLYNKGDEELHHENDDGINDVSED